MSARSRTLCDEAHDAVAAGVNILILSDRARSPDRAPIPTLLAVGAVHHHLVREGTRLRAGLVLRVRRAARGPSLRDADRLRRRRDQPVPAARHRRRARRRRARRPASTTPTSRSEHRQGARQGPAEDDLEDGDLDDPVLLRRADLRGRRPRARARRPPLHRHRRRASAASACDVLARETLDRHARAWPADDRRAAARRRRLRVAPRRRAPHVEPGHDRAAPARGARRRNGATAATRSTRSTRALVNDDAARRATLRGCSSSAPTQQPIAARRGRAGEGDRASASRPARCRSARSRPSRTRRSRSR